MIVFECDQIFDDRFVWRKNPILIESDSVGDHRVAHSGAPRDEHVVDEAVVEGVGLPVAHHHAVVAVDRLWLAMKLQIPFKFKFFG